MRRFGMMLVLATLTGVTSIGIVVNLANSLRLSAAELDQETMIVVALRTAVTAEDGLAHQLVDRGSLVAAEFLASDTETKRLIAQAMTIYDTSAALGLVETFRLRSEEAYKDLRAVAADPQTADTFSRDLADRDGFHRALFPKRFEMERPLADLEILSRSTVHQVVARAGTVKYWLTAMLGGLLVLVAGLTIVFARRLIREVLQPIDQLNNSARLFAGGRLDHRIDVFGTDEFARLAVQFNAMAAALASKQQHLTTQAHYDHLTGLLNRAQFNERLADTLEKAGQSPVWIGFIDLDDFKFVNDSAGHRAGDEVLRQVANRLLAASRPADIVARLGGDEFAIVFDTGDAEANTVELVAQRMIDALAEPMVIFGEICSVGASVGLACRHDPSLAIDTLVRHADIAMYTAKSRGKNCWARYDPELHGPVSERRGHDRRIEAGSSLLSP